MRSIGVGLARVSFSFVYEALLYYIVYQEVALRYPISNKNYKSITYTNTLAIYS
jgi:hypothetical protein